MMEKLPMCRICLVQNFRMYVVVNTDLQELYEKLTHIPFVTEDRRPILACFVCCTKLKQCYQLLKKCLDSEEHLVKMMNENYEPNHLINQDCLDLYCGFIKSPIQQITILDECQTESNYIIIKQESPAVCEGLDDIIEPKEERHSDELESDSLDQSCLVEIDIPPQHSESDSEDDVPLMEFKTEVVEEEVSEKKQKTREIKRMTVAKKQKLDTQRTNLEGPITPKQTTKEKRDSKVIRTTEKRTSTPGTNFKESYKCEQRTDNGVKPKCYVYQRNFSHKSNFAERITDSGEKPFQCKVCQCSFSKKCDLTKHIRIHTGEKPYTCDICQRSFNQKSHLTSHIRIHTGEKPYKCNVCQCSFSAKGQLTKHFRKHTGERPFRCNLCDRSFSQNCDLTKHILVHTREKPFKCDVCQRSFSHKCNLRGHTRIHTGEKPFECDVCQRSFYRKSHLTKHSRIHTGEKPYNCVLCQRCFKQKSDLTNHIRVHTGEKPYKCDLCDRCFRQKGNLKRHVSIHTGEKSYKCDICNRSFSAKSDLLRHLRLHTGEKPYKCEFCQLTFNRKSHLAKHIHVHTKENPV